MTADDSSRAARPDKRQELVLADIRASLLARDLEYAKAIDPGACALLARLAAEFAFELSFLVSTENFTARLTDTRPAYGGRLAVLHFQSWNARWSGDPGGRGLDVSEVGAWLAAYRAHPTWHADSLYDDMRARMRSAEASAEGAGTETGDHEAVRMAAMDDETAMTPAGVSRWENGSTGEFIEGPEFWALVDRHRISGNRLEYHSGAFRASDGTWYWPQTTSPSERARVIGLRTHALWWAEHERDTSVIPALSDGALKHYRLLASIRADDTTAAAADQELRRRGIRNYQIAGTLPESVRFATQPAIPDAAETASGHAMAVEYEQGGYRAVAGGRSAEYVNGHLIRWLTEDAGCGVIRVFDAVAEARQKFPPGTRVTADAAQLGHGTVTGGYAPADDGGCSVAVQWDHYGTSSAVPVTLLRAQVRPGDAVWHPDGPSIGTVREAGSVTVRVAFRGLPDRRVPVAELAAIRPGDPVRVTFLHSRPSMFRTSTGVTVREGTYVGPVPMEPSLSHVRTGGILRRLPTEYVSVPGPAGQAAALAWSRGLSAARAAGPGKEARSQDRPGTRAAHARAEDIPHAAPAAETGADRVTRSTGEFPSPLRPAAPETNGAKARKPAIPRPGLQVPPRTRGRNQ